MVAAAISAALLAELPGLVAGDHHGLRSKLAVNTTPWCTQRFCNTLQALQFATLQQCDTMYR